MNRKFHYAIAASLVAAGLWGMAQSNFVGTKNVTAASQNVDVVINSNCTAVNELFGPSTLTWDVSPSANASGALVGPQSLALTGPIQGNNAIDSAHSQTDARFLTGGFASAVWKGPVFRHDLSCQGLTAPSGSNATLQIKAGTVEPLLSVAVGATGASDYTSLSELDAVTPKALYTGVGGFINGLNFTARSFLSYGVSGGTSDEDVPYKLGLKRSVAATNTATNVTTTITFTSTVQ